jgi:hypothetical protein
MAFRGYKITSDAEELLMLHLQSLGLSEKKLSSLPNPESDVNYTIKT